MIVSVSRSVRPLLPVLTAACKNVKTLQKINNQRHQQQYLSLHGSRLTSVSEGLVEYSYPSMAVSGASDLIVEPL
jgi:hypothetical protein